MKKNLLTNYNHNKKKAVTDYQSRLSHDLVRVFFPLGPNAKKQAHRGVGRYWQYLTEAFREYNLAKIVTHSRNAEIVHYTYFDLFFPTLKTNFGWGGQKPAIVVTIHDVIPLVLAKMYPVGLRGKLALRKQKRALKKVDLILTDSESSQADISQYLSLPIKKIKVVPLAANPNLAPASELMIKQVKNQYNLKKPYILYVGDINVNKNLPALIGSLRYLPDQIDLVCVGKNFHPQNIPEWQAIQEQIVVNQLEFRVRFLDNILGDKADETLAALYSGAICYVQPSLYEGFGLPVLEAMSCGVPVVCTANSSLLEVAGGQAVLAPHEDALGLAEGVKEVLSWTSEHRQKKILAGLKYAKTFSWRKVAVETCYWYNRLLNGTFEEELSSLKRTN